MVLNPDELRERLDAVRAARVRRAVDLNDRLRELEETLDHMLQEERGSAPDAGGEGDGAAFGTDSRYWIEYEL